MLGSLFGGKDKEETKKESIINDYHLNDLPEEDKENIDLIAYRTIGIDMAKFGSKAEDNAKIRLLQALVEQNWIIMKMLNEISSKLDR